MFGEMVSWQMEGGGKAGYFRKGRREVAGWGWGWGLPRGGCGKLVDDNLDRYR